VKVGFYTGNQWAESDDPNSLRTKDQTNKTAVAGETDDWIYSVIATEALRPPEVIDSTIAADGTRNAGVLTDDDDDAVKTRVMEPFSYKTITGGFTNGEKTTKYIILPGGYVPVTGEDLLHYIIVLALSAASVICLILMLVRKRSSKGDKEG
jgi:hypothetical protein